MDSNYSSKRSRIWPSLAVGAGSIALAGLISNIILYIIISPNLGPDQKFGSDVIDTWMQQNMATPTGFFSMVIPIHIGILLLALIAASLSRTPLIERLGLVRGKISIKHYPILMLSCLGAAAISGWLFLAHISPGEDEMALALTFTQLRGFNGIMIIMYTATLATFAEELLFNGFVLRGLLRRWKPIFAIGLSSLFFSLIHPTPFFMLHAFIIGIWSGIIVWRSHSIWPAIACHSFLNIALAILNRWYPKPTVAFFGELTFWPIAVGIFGIIMMGITIKIVFKNDDK